MDIVLLIFVAFYLFIGVMVLRDRSCMHWQELRKKYGYSREKYQTADKPNDGYRFVYTINKRWHSTNYIETRMDANNLYLCGDNYYLFWGWLHPPVKIPFSDLEYCGTKRYWFNKRDVVQLTVNGHTLKYGIPNEIFSKFWPAHSN